MILRIPQKVGYWHAETMTTRNCRRARALSWLARVTISEQISDWVDLVAFVYKGVQLPDAVAASLERIEARAKACDESSVAYRMGKIA